LAAAALRLLEFGGVGARRRAASSLFSGTLFVVAWHEVRGTRDAGHRLGDDRRAV